MLINCDECDDTTKPDSANRPACPPKHHAAGPVSASPRPGINPRADWGPAVARSCTHLFGTRIVASNGDVAQVRDAVFVDEQVDDRHLVEDAAVRRHLVAVEKDGHGRRAVHERAIQPLEGMQPVHAGVGTIRRRLCVDRAFDGANEGGWMCGQPKVWLARRPAS